MYMKEAQNMKMTEENLISYHLFVMYSLFISPCYLATHEFHRGHVFFVSIYWPDISTRVTTV